MARHRPGVGRVDGPYPHRQWSNVGREIRAEAVGLVSDSTALRVASRRFVMPVLASRGCLGACRECPRRHVTASVNGVLSACIPQVDFCAAEGCTGAWPPVIVTNLSRLRPSTHQQRAEKETAAMALVMDICARKVRATYNEAQNTGRSRQYG